LKTYTANIEPFGNVEFVKYTTSLSIKIIIKNNATIKVTMPQIATYEDATNFVLSKKDWILEALKKINENKSNLTFIDCDKKDITPFHDLFLIKAKRENIYITVKERNLVVKYPDNLMPSNKRVQDAIKQAIEIGLKNEAIKYIPARLYHLAYKHNLKYNGVKISFAKTKWGSCSFDNNIIISLYIMLLPTHLIDYVLIHELAHTIVKNHSILFWNLLQQLDNNAINMDKELKKYHIPEK